MGGLRSIWRPCMADASVWRRCSQPALRWRKKTTYLPCRCTHNSLIRSHVLLPTGSMTRTCPPPEPQKGLTPLQAALERGTEAPVAAAAILAQAGAHPLPPGGRAIQLHTVPIFPSSTSGASIRVSQALSLIPGLAVAQRCARARQLPAAAISGPAWPLGSGLRLLRLWLLRLLRPMQAPTYSPPTPAPPCRLPSPEPRARACMRYSLPQWPRRLRGWKW